MTVRDAEKLVRRTIDPPKETGKPEPDANIEHLETKLFETPSQSFH